jgi:hypothetical protein
MDYGGEIGKSIGTRDIEEVHRQQFDFIFRFKKLLTRLAKDVTILDR